MDEGLVPDLPVELVLDVLLSDALLLAQQAIAGLTPFQLRKVTSHLASFYSVILRLLHKFIIKL